ncbi:hypothetical protein DNTS_000350, partial [Danionella cerebrum]
MRAVINQKLIEMGERERLKELLRAKLIECGWRDQVKALCKDVIKEKGIENVTVEDLVTAVTPKGRGPIGTRPTTPQPFRASRLSQASLVGTRNTHMFFCMAHKPKAGLMRKNPETERKNESGKKGAAVNHVLKSPTAGK